MAGETLSAVGAAAQTSGKQFLEQLSELANSALLGAATEARKPMWNDCLRCNPGLKGKGSQQRCGLHTGKSDLAISGILLAR